MVIVRANKARSSNFVVCKKAKPTSKRKEQQADGAQQQAPAQVRKSLMPGETLSRPGNHQAAHAQVLLGDLSSLLRAETNATQFIPTGSQKCNCVVQSET